jgi:hypothetical protein
VIVGCGVTKTQFEPQCIALTLGRKPPSSYLWLGYVLQLDSEDRYLTVAKSGYALYLDPNRDDLVFHYDYEREPSHPYQPAHVQVEGETSPLCGLAERRGQAGKQLRDFHFPVGGRRYRPTLEDVVEFLVLEDLVDAHREWRDVIQEGRDEWELVQLRAAVRRNPEAALAQLREDRIVP